MTIASPTDISGTSGAGIVEVVVAIGEVVAGVARRLRALLPARVVEVPVFDPLTMLPFPLTIVVVELFDDGTDVVVLGGTVVVVVVVVDR